MPLPRRLRRAFLLPLAALVALAGGCGGGEDAYFNFSQYPGFEAIRAELPDEAPSAAEREALRRHAPRLFVADGAATPLDFYADYIGSGRLQVGGRVILNPTAAELNAHRHDPAAVFSHAPTAAKTTPVAYGGVHRAKLDLPGLGERDLVFLSYHFAFRQSGLPAGLGRFWRGLADIAADSEDWHQLDHYTAAFVVLDGGDGGEPIAVILQQHNYMRAYLTGGEDFPRGETARLEAAISSNELYPRKNGRTARPAAGNLTARSVGYLTETEDGGGFGAAADITHGTAEVRYALRFLPPNDAFYVFEGWLGEKRLLPGREGPPGAIYRTLPALWRPEVALYAFYWRAGDREYADIIRAAPAPWKDAATMDKLKRRFADALRAMREKTRGEAAAAAARLVK